MWWIFDTKEISNGTRLYFRFGDTDLLEMLSKHFTDLVMVKEIHFFLECGVEYYFFWVVGDGSVFGTTRGNLDYHILSLYFGYLEAFEYHQQVILSSVK